MQELDVLESEERWNRVVDQFCVRRQPDQRAPAEIRQDRGRGQRGDGKGFGALTGGRKNRVCGTEGRFRGGRKSEERTGRERLREQPDMLHRFI